MPENAPDTIAPAFDSEDHRRILQHVLDRVLQAEAQHKLMVPAWQENYRAFRAQSSRVGRKRKDDWQSDVRTPYIAEQVLTMLPRQVEGKPSVDVLRLQPEVPHDVVRAQRHLLNQMLWQDGFPMKAARWALNDILFGVGWSKQSFLRTVRKRDQLDAYTGQHRQIDVVTANRATMGIGHPYDVMADPRAVTLESARFVVWRTVSTVRQVRANRRRRVRTPDGLERWTGRYANVDEVRSFGKGRDDMLPNEVNLPEYVSARCGNGTVELLEVFDTELDYVFTVANRQVVLNAYRMPWWHGEAPVSCAVTTPDVATLHGLSQVDWMRPLQEMLHKLENQKLDNQRLQMDLVLLIRDTVMDVDDYQLGPGAKWPVQNMDDVQVLQYPQPQLASVQDLEMLRGRLQAIVGSAYQSGADPSGMGVNQDTASGLLAIIEEGNRRVDFRMNLMSLAYERAFQQCLSNAAQFLETAVYVPGANRNEDPIPVHPNQLAAKSWVKVTLGSETGMKSLRQQMAQNLAMSAQQLNGTPIPTPQGLRSFNPYPIVEALADAYDRDPDEFLYDQQQFAAQLAPTDPAAMLAAAQGGGAPGMVVPQLPPGMAA